MSMLTFFPITSSGLIAEQARGGCAERLHDSANVDHHHGVRNGVEDRLDMGLASQRGTRALIRMQFGIAEPLAEPRRYQLPESRK